MRGTCLCQNTTFHPYIVYKNETVFKKYEGTIIGRCTKCRLLRTFNDKIKPTISQVETYETKNEEYKKEFRPILSVLQGRNIKNVLDIGCASGILLSLLEQRGYNVYGLEPNKEAYIQANKKFPRRIFYGTLRKFKKNNKKRFDAVIYNHVLEHIQNVAEEIELIKRSLTKNGLLIIGVPNTRSIIFSVRKKYWESILPDQHVWHFSDTYLTEYLQKKELRLLHKSYAHYSRADYPVIKRVYFSLLKSIDVIARTGEAVLLTFQLR